MSKENELIDIDVLMDQKFGKEGTPEREKFREETYNFCVGQMISEARKQEKITQVELANRIGSSKSYISQIYDYEESLKNFRDMYNTISSAERKGRAGGRVDERIVMAKSLKSQGVDSEIIKTASGLSIEEIEKL